ncbi:MAG TPA: RodZ domain-containing protein [Halomicronema sp.]
MKKNKNKVIPNLVQERQEKLDSLGAELRRVRQQQELSIEEVSARTMIGVRILQAIEEANLQELPEPIYIQGFIRKFANALGLNGATFASDFPTETNMRLLNYGSWIPLPGVQLRPIHLYAIYVLLIVSSVQGLSYMVNRSAIQASNLQDISEPVSENLLGPKPTPATQLTAMAASSQNSSKTVSEDKGQVRIGLTLKAESWIEVEADGKTAFEGMLPQGTQRTWFAKEQLIVRAGNAGGVLVAVNNGQAKQMGAPGKVEELRVKAN